MFSGYTELRLQHNEMRRVQLVNGSVVTNQSVSRGGVSARVRDGGAWGFASDADTADTGVERVLRAATDNARWLGRRGGRDLGALPSRSGSSVDRFNTKQRRWTSAEVVDFLEELDRLIAARHPQVRSRTLTLGTLDMAKALATSTGSESDSLVPRTILNVSLSMMADGEPVRLSTTHGGFGQLEDVLTAPGALTAAIEQQVRQLEDKCRAVHARAGASELVLDADLAGILAHEAIGHTTEADLVLGGSVAGPNVGKTVASELVSLTDFANTAFGQRCPVPVYVDDEGTAAQDVPIIADGVLKGFMHNKETALRFGVAPTGNARAFEFSDEPLVRMRNTSFLPGNSTLEEMIASVDDGYYLMRASNGQADATSEFMFGVVLGYEIKGGKLGRAIRDTTISGVAFDVLRTVSMVSGQMSWQCGGMCGKKQPIPVGMGGPAIKCRANLGGQ
jgi:TldD protein